MHSHIAQSFLRVYTVTKDKKSVWSAWSPSANGSPRASSESCSVQWVHPEKALQVVTDPLYILRMQNLLKYDGRIQYSVFHYPFTVTETRVL